jgi:hypothetical protein
MGEMNENGRVAMVVRKNNITGKVQTPEVLCILQQKIFGKLV